MKFMVLWEVHEDRRHEALEGFAGMTTDDDKADMGEGIKLIGRWHDLVGFTGVAICETSDPVAIHRWLLNWNGILDAEVRPVLDDDETRVLGRAMFVDD